MIKLFVETINTKILRKHHSLTFPKLKITGKWTVFYHQFSLQMMITAWNDSIAYIFTRWNAKPTPKRIHKTIEHKKHTDSFQYFEINLFVFLFFSLII